MVQKSGGVFLETHFSYTTSSDNTLGGVIARVTSCSVKLQFTMVFG